MELVEGPGGVNNNLFLLLHVKEECLTPGKTLRIARQVVGRCRFEVPGSTPAV